MRIKTASVMLVGLFLCGCADRPDPSPAAPTAASVGPSASVPAPAPTQQSAFPPAAAGQPAKGGDSWFTVGRGAATGAGAIVLSALALSTL